MDINELPHNKDLTYFARTNFRGSNQLFGVKRKDRRQHMYVLGKSGTGKSVLLQNMIIQNIRNGEGVCVVDPHGELVEGILESIPRDRLKDVIYFNPADTDFHIGFNVLELEDPKYKHLVASGLMGIFTKIWANAWSARMEYILNNAILALLDTPGTTLLGIPRLLVDKDYRQTIINNLKDPVVKAFWVHEYEQWRDQFRNEAIAPIQNKVGQFLSTSIVRNVVGQNKSTINIFDIMNTGKIFLVNVSKGRIGEDNSALLGGMIITKIQLAAMERVRVPEDERKDFYLYVDEFQNFVTEAFASILSEARKYRLNLIIAHQYTGQLVTDAGTAVRDAVFGNVGTMIVFRVGAPDADFLEQEFSPEIMPEDLVALPNYNIYLKLMVDGFTSRPFSATTIPPLKVPGNLVSVEEIIDTSRKLYTLPKKEIEDQINRWSGNMGGRDDEFGGETGKDGAGMYKAKCAICGKDIMVPFEPEPGRPIYCKEDLAKIKAGEIQPIKSTPRTEQQINKTYDDLSALGIEFKMVDDGTKKVPLPARALDSRPKNKPVIRHEPRTAPDTGELQAALKSALSTILPPKKAEPKSEIKKEETIAPVQKIIPQEEPKNIPLSSLKQSPEAVKPAYVQAKKEASAEHVSALKDVIAKAMADKKPVAEIPKNDEAEKQKEIAEKEARAKEAAEKEKQEQERKQIEMESMKKAEEEMKKRMIEEEALKKKEEEVARIAEENRKHIEELERQN